MSNHFRTTSGAHYEINGDRIRRVNSDSDTVKRADGEWVELVSMFPPAPVVGESVRLVLEPLERFGVDDYGSSGGSTIRTTTPVTEVWET